MCHGVREKLTWKERGKSPSNKVIMIPFIIVIAIEFFSRPLTVILSKHLIYERNHCRPEAWCSELGPMEQRTSFNNISLLKSAITFQSGSVNKMCLDHDIKFNSLVWWSPLVHVLLMMMSSVLSISHLSLCQSQFMHVLFQWENIHKIGNEPRRVGAKPNQDESSWVNKEIN